MRFIAICLSLVLSVSAFAEKPRIKTFDEAWKTTKANFYDKKQMGE